MLFVVDFLKVSAFKSIPTNQNKNALRMIFNYSKQNVIQLSKLWFSRKNDGFYTCWNWITHMLVLSIDCKLFKIV